MRKLKILEHISLDGVIQAPGGPNEEPDYPHGGWAAPYHDDAVGEAIAEAQSERFDLLLGRRTYDIFAGYWPMQAGPMAGNLNAAPKYVATHRPDSLDWGPAKHLGEDAIEGIRRAKAEDGPDLIVWGSSTLTPLLLVSELADEILLLIFPVLLGTGKPLFRGTVGPRALTLANSKAASSGVLINTYRPDGPLRTGTIGDAQE